MISAFLAGNDLVNWTKYGKNPLWNDARWPTVLQNVDRKHPRLLYFAITRGYDTPSSYIVLATSEDGIHRTQMRPSSRRCPTSAIKIPIYFTTRGRDASISLSIAATIAITSRLSTEIYPHRYTDNLEGESQVKVFFPILRMAIFSPSKTILSCGDKEPVFFSTRSTIASTGSIAI
jgi:hypothetical protein